jgi:thiamine transporter ThiT
LSHETTYADSNIRRKDMGGIYIAVGIAAVFTIIILIVHFKKRRFATFGLNLLLVAVFMFLGIKTGTLGGLIIGIVASTIVSLYFQFWSPVKGADKDIEQGL